MHQEMARAMKRIKKMGGLKGLAAMFGKGGGADLGGAMVGMAGLPKGSLPPGFGGGAGSGGGLPPDLARLLGKK